MGLLRKGRPPKVRRGVTGRGMTYYIKVKEVELAFARGAKGLLRVDRNANVPSEEVAYAKQLVERELAQ